MKASPQLKTYITENARNKGLSMRALAARLGKDPGNLNRQLAGQLNVEIEDLRAIASILNISVDEIYQAAGILESAELPGEKQTELDRIFVILQPGDQDTLLKFARFLGGQHARE